MIAETLRSFFEKHEFSKKIKFLVFEMCGDDHAFKYKLWKTGGITLTIFIYPENTYLFLDLNNVKSTFVSEEITLNN